MINLKKTTKSKAELAQREMLVRDVKTSMSRLNDLTSQVCLYLDVDKLSDDMLEEVNNVLQQVVPQLHRLGYLTKKQ